MKILVISNLYPPSVLGGYEILCQQVCDSLRARGHEVVVLTTPTGDEQPERDVHRTLRLYRPFHERAGIERGRRFKTARHNEAVTRQLIAQCRPDLIFIWSQLRLTLGAARAAEASGVPVAYTLNDDHLVGYAERSWSGGARDLVRWAIDRVALRNNTLRALKLENVTCISECLRQNLVAHGVPVDRAVVIHQGIPMERFLARPLNGLGTPPRLLYVGQLHHYKGVHTLVEAARLVARRRPLRLDIVGSGPADYLDMLQRGDNGALDLRFHGKVSHERLPSLYREHDVFVFPSIWQEPFGLTHLEAMASGLPVISTAHGGHGEFLRDGENALVFEPADAAGLAIRIERMLDDGALRARLAAQGTRCVATRYSLQRYVSDIESWLTSIAKEEARSEHRARAEKIYA